MIGNDPGFTGGVWEAYAVSKAWTLSSGDGTKTVYVKFRDSSLNVGSTYNDTIILDTALSTSGSISYTDGSYTPPTSVTLTVSDGTDSLSGVNTASRVVERKQAALSVDTCGSYGSFATISVAGTYPSFTDSSISSGNCYQYEYQVSDNVGNQATYTSTSVVKVLYASPSAAACSDTTPTGNTPWLYEANASSGNSITLRFTNWQTPVDHFALEYGINSNNYQYAADNIGGNGTNIYTVNYLNPNTTYYFRVRAGNGCATGSWSNEISAKTKGFVSFNQLDLSSQLLTVPAEQVQPVGTSGSCQTYTVKPNDNLWSIAMTLLGDGNKYKDIITENSNSYPTLKTSNNVSVGWELKINCSSEANKSSETTTTTNTPTGGYKVNIKVKDTKGNSIENATVTIHSTPQTEKTNKDGTATFNNVEAGNHTINIAYNNYQGEQSINLTGDVKEFNINVTVQQKPILLSPLAYGIIGILVLIIALLSFKIIKSKKQRSLAISE